MNKVIIFLLEIWLLYITYKKIIKINKGENVRIIDNILAIVLGTVLAFFEWNSIYSEGWILYFMSLIIVCSILPIYYIVKKYIINLN